MTTAVYFDVENVKNFDLSELMRSLEKNEDNTNNLITIKLAAGQAESIKPYLDQLKNENFTIIEAPHLANKKNRADIILSVKAHEDFLCHKPEIEKFVFITSDSDYTFVMDKVRRAGKTVWLVCKGEDAEKQYFKTCTDTIIPLEKNPKVNRTLDDLKKYFIDNQFTEADYKKFIEYYNDKEFKKGEKPIFNYDGKKIKKLKTLLTKLTDELFIDREKMGNAYQYKLLAK
jgi:hypothetical protein